MGMHQSRGIRHLMCGAAASVVLAAAGAAHAQEEQTFQIAPQPLVSALYEFGEQSGRQVLFKPSLADDKLSAGISSKMEQGQALAQLLQGTGLTYRKSGDVYLIVQEGEGGGPQGQSAAGGGAEVETLIVTAQKKEEQIQDVPIAISAFTQKSLDAQKIEGGFDLLKAIPNVTFSKTNFTGYNFSIRGIGTKAISATTDPGVAVAFNNSGLIVNRLFEQEYFDVERVEVLRGPQGTLYGRNATSGVINVISAKPRLGEFEADVKAEIGNYDARRVRAMVNVPIGDLAAVRAAFAMTKRSGYGTNLIDGSDVDDRDLWSSRVTFGFEPTERLRVNALWEHFEEDDQRVRTSKQLCHNDPGLSEINGVPVLDQRMRAQLSQGCLPGSLYDDGAFGTPTGDSLPFILAAGLPSITTTADVYASRTQSRNLREIESTIEPAYRAKSDIFDLSIDLDVTDSLTLTSQTLYTQDSVYSTQDLNRFRTAPIFPDSLVNPNAVPFPTPGSNVDYWTALTPGGVYCDPQLGCSDRMVAQDISQSESTQFNQEIRIASNFDGPVNFSLGSNYTYFETENDYFVFINVLTYLAQIQPPFNAPASLPGVGRCYAQNTQCVYVDPNPLESIDGDGHNYFRSRNPYRLTSRAVFGELYWELTPTVKLTAGARMTWDRKDFTPVPSQTLLRDYRENQSPTVEDDSPPEACTQQAAPLLCGLDGTGVGGRGYPAEPDIVQQWREPTGRLVVDWKPDLAFTDETMLYASLARGYKGGGANPPGIAKPQGMFNQRGREALAPPTFEPEFVDALEIGTKNTLLDGGLILNGGAFYYDYKDYQVSKIIDRTSVNENFDAKLWGLELEWIFSPSRNLRFNGTIGHLRTEIAEGEQSIDLMNRTQGNPDWVLVKPAITATSNCLAPADLVAMWVATKNANPNTLSEFGALCPAGGLSGFNHQNSPIPGTGGQTFDPFAFPEINAGSGFYDDLSGNELPNAPHWTASIGAQYRMALPAGWDATFRGDFYWQSQSFARVHNTEYDKLRGWTNTNLSLWVENPELGLTAEVYVKNVMDETPITDAFLFSDDTGLVTNVFTLDPRLIGVSLRKTF